MNRKKLFINNSAESRSVPFITPHLDFGGGDSVSQEESNLKSRVAWKYEQDKNFDSRVGSVSKPFHQTSNDFNYGFRSMDKQLDRYGSDKYGGLGAVGRAGISTVSGLVNAASGGIMQDMDENISGSKRKVPKNKNAPIKVHGVGNSKRKPVTARERDRMLRGRQASRSAQGREAGYVPSARTRTAGTNIVGSSNNMPPRKTIKKTRRVYRPKKKGKAPRKQVVRGIRMPLNRRSRRPREQKEFKRIIDIPRAPVNQMATVRSGHRILFSNVPGGIHMNMHFRIAQIRVDSGGTFITFNTQGGSSQDLTILPANTFYFPGYITNLTRLFDLWKPTFAQITIEPRQNTSQTAAYVVASPPEIEWAESRGQLTGGLATPNEQSLVSLDNACTTVCYDRCRSVATLYGGPAKGGRFYMAGPNLATQVSYTTQTAADLRSSVGCQWLISGTTGGLAANALLADVYIDIGMDLIGFSTSLTTLVSNTEPKEEEQKLVIPKKETIFSDDEEPTVLVTPQKSSSRKSNRGV